MKYTVKPLPQKGDTRTNIKFAWLPVRIEYMHPSDNMVTIGIWFERYTVIERFTGRGWYVIKKELL